MITLNYLRIVTSLPGVWCLGDHWLICFVWSFRGKRQTLSLWHHLGWSGNLCVFEFSLRVFSLLVPPCWRGRFPSDISASSLVLFSHVSAVLWPTNWVRRGGYNQIPPTGRAIHSWHLLFLPLEAGRPRSRRLQELCLGTPAAWLADGWGLFPKVPDPISEGPPLLPYWPSQDPTSKLIPAGILSLHGDLGGTRVFSLQSTSNPQHWVYF